MKFVKKMVENFEKTIILDADGLYAAAEAKIDFKSCPGRLILTPHVGEFARLTGLSASEIEEKRLMLRPISRRRTVSSLSLRARYGHRPS